MRLKGSMHEQERKEIFQLLVHSSNIQKSHAGTRSKPGAQISIRISYVDDRDSCTLASISCLLVPRVCVRQPLELEMETRLEL